MNYSSFNKDLQGLIQDTEKYLLQLKEETKFGDQGSMLSSYIEEDRKTPLPKIASSSKVLPTFQKSHEIYSPKPSEEKKTEIQRTATPLEQAAPLQPVTTEKKAPSRHGIQTLALHPPIHVHKDLLQDIRAVIMKLSPSTIVSRPIPSDDKAKKIKNSWKESSRIPDVALLAGKIESIPFLENVAKAIDLHFFPCKVLSIATLEKNKSFDLFLEAPNLKLVIAPDTVIWNCKELMTKYHEIPQKKERYLGKTPLILLPDPSLYLKDPSLKRSLWTLLCQVLKSMQ